MPVKVKRWIWFKHPQGLTGLWHEERKKSKLVEIALLWDHMY